MIKKHVKNKILCSILEWIASLVIVIAICLFINEFVVSRAVVNSTSMEPTFRHGEVVLVNRFIYRFTRQKPGDIIVFPYKGMPLQYFVKRVVGLPGDVIDIVDYQFTVNGIVLEDAFSEEPVYALGNVVFPLTVPEDSIFVLGDNRNGSKDSRYSDVGCIPRSDIVGKVFMRIWPLNSIHIYN